MIQVAGDRFASANIELSRIGQDGQEGGPSIFHNPVSCVSANQFPVFDATFDPPGSVVSAKLYFKSNLSDEWFYTEFQLLTGNFPRYRWTMVTDPSRSGAKSEGDDT